MRKKDKNKERKEVIESYSFITQFGLNMIVPILGCTFIGGYLDNRFSTNFLVIVGFFLGAAAGYTSIYKTVRRRWKADKKENEDEKRH